MSLGTEIQVGVISGNASTVIVRCGFVPNYVLTVNITDSDQKYEWFENMSSVTLSTGMSSLGSIATEGIYKVVGDDDEAAGFMIGTTVSESAKQISYIAIRSGRGFVTDQEAG